MKHNILTATFISLGLFSASAAFADTSTTVQENILVTADRTLQDQYLSLSATQIIDKADIEAFQPHSVVDLLDKVAGISVVKQGDAGQQSSVFMRGTNNGHTLILVDGVRVGSATLGATNFGSMSVAQIERIEIVKGPRAALWGSDAIGGVIQIFTKKLQAGEATISAGFGSNGLWKTGISVGLGSDQHSLTLSVSAQESDGFSAITKEDGEFEIDDDGYERLAFSAIGQSKLNDQFSLHLASRWEQGSYEYDASFAGAANEQDFENYHLRVAGQYDIGDFFGELSVATSQDQGATFGNGIAKADSDEIKTKRDQLSLLGQYSLSEQTSLTAGFDWYNENVSTNTDKVSWVDGFQSWDVDQRDVKALFVQARHQSQEWLLEGAVRRDDIENMAAKTTYNASVGYQLNDAWLVSLNRSTGFKAPSFNDLYWPGSGNPDLKPESITSNEILLRNKFEQGSFEVSVFESSVENLIAWAPNAAGAWQPSNINQADIKGVELSLALSSGALSHQLAIAYIDATDSEKNIPLARRPQLTGNYTLAYQWQALTASGALSYRDDSADKASETSAILDSYWLADISLNYQVTEKLSFNAKVNNLFDEQYETAKNYVADGTNYVVSVAYSF